MSRWADNQANSGCYPTHRLRSPGKLRDGSSRGFIGSTGSSGLLRRHHLRWSVPELQGTISERRLQCGHQAGSCLGVDPKPGDIEGGRLRIGLAARLMELSGSKPTEPDGDSGAIRPCRLIAGP